uniref:Synaptopodin 2 n=1 Tax=Lepisosteus oculatus TaxID=7918 RepID=W5N479_LEPOC
MKSTRMVTGDYICITVRGGAPWGFVLQGGKEFQLPLQISEVDEGSKAASAGLCKGDEVVSLNGEPCADWALSEAMALIDGSADTLQVLVKRCGVHELSDPSSEKMYFDESIPNEGLASTTLQIWPSRGAPPPRELYISESQDEAYYGETESDTDLSCATRQARAKSPNREKDHLRERSSLETSCRGAKQGAVTPGTVVELQLSFSDHNQGDPSVTPGSNPWGEKHSTLGGLQKDRSLDISLGGSKTELLHTTAVQSFCLPRNRGDITDQGQGREPVSSSSSLGQVEVTLEHPREGKRWGEIVVCRTESSLSGCVDSQEEGGHIEAPPASVSFGISSEGAEQAEEWDSESEWDHSRPNKHRPRHSRLRRSESLSEKQVKEAKSKCKRIALLLTAAPNPNNKGVLMFKKHRQRAKKFTLVSYGTGEQEPEEEADEEEEEGDEDDAIEVTLLATSESEIDEDFFTDARGRTRIVTFDWDTGLLEIEKKLDNQEEMERLPETKGKGALMFAKRRQRVDQITAEQEEMRRKGIPVEDPHEPATTESAQVTQHTSHQENFYTQSKAENQTHVSQGYIDVNVQKQQQQHHQQQYSLSQSVNGVVHHQTNDMQKSSVTNRTARPFTGVQNRMAAPFLPSKSVASPVSDQPSYSDNKYRVVLPPVPVNAQPQVWSPTGFGEQIASRDERISVPAIKTGILQETRKKNTAKPMFTFKEPPKVSPNPALLNLLNKGDKRHPLTGFESGPEEDYLSLGAEACNFLQSPAIKQKTPPPVAPKPTINPASPPWSPAPATANQTPPSQPPLNEAPTPALNPAQAPPQQHPPSERTWTPPQTQARNQQPASTWSQPQNQATAQQKPANVWSPPQQQQLPVSTWTPAQTHSPSQQPVNMWSQPQPAPNAFVSLPAPRSVASAYTHTSKTPPSTPIGNVASAGGMGPAFEMPALRGRGAELFAKRQSRMEKFVVDSSTVQASKPRSISPTPSLPSSWKYSSNIRAPPPLAYNPIQSPSYPPGAIKSQPQSQTGPTGKTKTKGKTTTKVLHALDVMKHQPYQLNSALFTYGPVSDPKGPPPKAFSAPPKQPPEYDAVAPMKPAGQGLGRSYSLSLPRRMPTLPGYDSPVSSPLFQPAKGPLERQTSWLDRGSKPPTPWEAAARSPLGLVDEAFSFQNIQKSIASNVISAAQRKTLPEPPAEWKERVSYEPSLQSRNRFYGQLGSMSPSRSIASAPASSSLYGFPFKYSYQPQKSVTESNIMDIRSDYGAYGRSINTPNYNVYPRAWKP